MLFKGNPGKFQQFSWKKIINLYIKCNNNHIKYGIVALRLECWRSHHRSLFFFLLLQYKYYYKIERRKEKRRDIVSRGVLVNPKTNNRKYNTVVILPNPRLTPGIFINYYAGPPFLCDVAPFWSQYCESTTIWTSGNER